jgi:hypothetical protein
MNLLKDLLYTKGNLALDIARTSAMLGVLTFLGLVLWQKWTGEHVDLIAFGTGWGLLCSGNAAWIYARQTKETPPASGDGQ